MGNIERDYAALLDAIVEYGNVVCARGLAPAEWQSVKERIGPLSANHQGAVSDLEKAWATIRDLDRLVCEFCKAVGEPIPVDAITLARDLSRGQ